MPTLNAERYASIVSDYDYAPKMIDSERENRRPRSVLEQLLFPDRKTAVEEDALAKLLIHLIGVYEDRAVVPPNTTARQALQRLMEHCRLKRADLVKLFGTPSIVSEILSGKREINARHARELSKFFGLSAGLFI